MSVGFEPLADADQPPAAVVAIRCSPRAIAQLGPPPNQVGACSRIVRVGDGQTRPRLASSSQARSRYFLSWICFLFTISVMRRLAAHRCVSACGGQREFVPVLARAAVAIGVAGIFIETHQDPDKAPSDGPNMISINCLEGLLCKLLEFDKLAKMPD